MFFVQNPNGKEPRLRMAAPQRLLTNLPYSSYGCRMTNCRRHRPVVPGAAINDDSQWNDTIHLQRTGYILHIFPICSLTLISLLGDCSCALCCKICVRWIRLYSRFQSVIIRIRRRKMHYFGPKGPKDEINPSSVIIRICIFLGQRSPSPY